jgi:DnaJ-class molecular chaperone
MRNFYDVLGVDPGADDVQVNDAFTSLMNVLHPDLHLDDAQAERRFKEIRQAYSILRDPRTRAAYQLGLMHQRRTARRRVSTAVMMGFTTSMLSTIVISFVMVWLLTEGQPSAATGQDAHGKEVPAPLGGYLPRR